MPLAAIVTLIGVFAIAGALALYLTTIAALLTNVTHTLDRILASIRQICAQTEPIRGPVSTIVGNVQAIEDAFARLPIPGSRGARTRARAR